MTQPIPEIDVKAAADHLDDYKIIDVRNPDEYTGPLGHVAGAELLPLPQLADSADVLGTGPLLLVCRSGKRSAAACEQLIERGITDVTNLAGGMIAWNEAGLPVEGKSDA